MKTSVIKSEPVPETHEDLQQAIHVLSSEEALLRVGGNGQVQKCMIAILIPCFTLANFIVYGVSYLTKRPVFYCGGVECEMEEACELGTYTTHYDNDIVNLTRVAGLECISDTKMGLIGSCYFIGFLVGAFFIPRMADVWGRRWVIIGGIFVNLLAILLFMLARSIELVYVSMVALGLQAPSTMQVGFVMITEIVATKYRAFYSTLILSINACLNLFIPGYYYFAKDYLYLMYANVGLSAIVFLFSLCFIAESPRYFMSTRKYA